MYYYIWSMVPIVFNYSYIFLMRVPMLYLLRFFLNWMIFPVILVLINFFKLKSGKIKPMGSFLISLFVMLVSYSTVYIIHYSTTDMPFEAFGVLALFLANMYFFMPFAVITAMDIAFAFFRPKQKKKTTKRTRREPAQRRESEDMHQRRTPQRSASGRTPQKNTARRTPSKTTPARGGAQRKTTSAKNSKNTKRR